MATETLILKLNGTKLSTKEDVLLSAELQKETERYRLSRICVDIKSIGLDGDDFIKNQHSAIVVITTID